MDDYIFSIQQEKEIKSFFDKYGVVAIKDVLTPLECTQTLKEIAEQLKSMNPLFDMNDVKTYDNMSVNNYGMYAGVPIFSQQFLANRQNPLVHKAFSIIYGQSNLLVNHDRCCYYRPTCDILINGKKMDKPHWQTSYNYPGLHLDFHPSTYLNDSSLEQYKKHTDYTCTKHYIRENNLYCKNDGLQVQGILNLIDNDENDGGFQCVLGFPANFDDWLVGFKHKNTGTIGAYDFTHLDKNDMKYVSKPIRIAVPAGAIVLWDQKMAHGSQPNNSNRARSCQFIKMFPYTIYTKDRYMARQKAVMKILKDNNFTDINETGKIVFGLNKYI